MEASLISFLVVVCVGWIRLGGEVGLGARGVPLLRNMMGLPLMVTLMSIDKSIVPSGGIVK
jgi:hypothetical protein